MIRIEKNKIQLQSFQHANTWSKQALGVMFKDKIESPMIFPIDQKDCMNSSYHTCFCPDLDMIFLDKDKKVIKIFWSVPSFNLIRAPQDSAWLVEHYAGIFDKFDLKVGDVLEF